MPGSLTAFARKHTIFYSYSVSGKLYGFFMAKSIETSLINLPCLLLKAYSSSEAFPQHRVGIFFEYHDNRLVKGCRQGLPETPIFEIISVRIRFLGAGPPVGC